MKPPASGDIICRSANGNTHSPSSLRTTTMPNQDPNAQRYITIARACLKAINDTASDNGSREEKIQAVYEAIDTAFRAEFSDYRQSVAIMATVLERIATGQLDAEAAASLARKTLDQQPETTRKAIIH